jgi:hypothetical protein
MVALVASKPLLPATAAALGTPSGRAWHKQHPQQAMVRYGLLGTLHLVHVWGVLLAGREAATRSTLQHLSQSITKCCHPLDGSIQDAEH